MKLAKLIRAALSTRAFLGSDVMNGADHEMKARKLSSISSARVLQLAFRLALHNILHTEAPLLLPSPLPCPIGSFSFRLSLLRLESLLPVTPDHDNAQEASNDR